ncbi:MAG: Zn-dependent M16 family peptidase [Candidatus Desulfovibrio kirbyi]|jgi:Zn-dependent M16 (insulinase) family peptidase|uniref:Zn-dependent M16 family peptidase n=1 Tax=Candidatus Desulfovibrio kirbyi TaxID=2696086 RepID=A0A6L2R437_9BACT|nr:insulinase family protein [Desulfovibrio sp.]GFH62273.1 MAG: Zn-dependent M16 family peptidase [Candidatus Desulfovibrio kirbyi]
MHDANKNFSLIIEQKIREINGTARLWRHNATGAQAISVTNDDENKCFGVSFRTPPADSTGVAHILEHSVLGGSKKYPVKEPFVELLKGSLQTFLNAFTFPDKTCYPVASATLRDFYNLIDVYLDAVFHPRITENTFRQEGWHIEAASANGPWAYKGVVYNEMKGVYSSPDSVLAEQSQQALFPDMLYRLDSGGNPEHIPDLTYEDFRAFHKRYYHPGNARFFFWGDDPEEERLRLLNTALAGYDNCSPDSGVPLQARLSTPRRVERFYAAEPGETRALFTVNWLLEERGDSGHVLLLEMLEHILEGMPGSPLRNALISSGLGEDTTGCGLETDLRQLYYSTGLKGIEPSDIPRAEALIFDVLTVLAHEGIDRQAGEAAVNSIEFAYRENNSGRFPRGLAAMLQSLSTWLYDKDPLAPLQWEKALESIKKRLADGERVFEQTIETYFLNNSHRAVVVLLPDSTLAEKREMAEQQRMRAALVGRTEQQLAELAEQTRSLQEAQNTPDSPQALASIPGLDSADLPRKNALIPRQEVKIPQTCLWHELPTRGIAYTSLLLPIGVFPDRLVPLLPLFARSLTETGTAKRDFAALGSLIAAKTGGVSADTMFMLEYGTRKTKAYLVIAGKAVYDKISDLFEIFKEILLEPQGDTVVLLERFRQMLLEEKARLEHGLQVAGHTAAGLRLRARFTGAAALNERTSGIAYLRSVRALIKQLVEKPEKILKDMEIVRRLCVAGADAIFDCAAESEGLHLVDKSIRALLAALPGRPVVEEFPEYPPLHLPQAEAFLTQAQVNYVGKAANLYDLGYSYHGSAAVILRYLRMGPLWEQVRARGGAYGVSCGLERASGTLTFTSYRDPNVDETLSAYDSMAAVLRNAAPDNDQITRSIVGAIGDMDAYMLPDAKGTHSLARWLTGDTDEDRQRLREEIFAVTPSHFIDFADMLESVARHGALCVLGGNKTKAAAKARGWTAKKLL